MHVVKSLARVGSEQWLTFRSLVTLIRSVNAIYVESSGKRS